MNKNFLLILLTIVCSILSISLVQMSNRAALLLKECKAASNVINQVYQDNEEYFLDVLIETDAWSEYQSIIPFDYYEEY